MQWQQIANTRVKVKAPYCCTCLLHNFCTSISQKSILLTWCTKEPVERLHGTIINWQRGFHMCIYHIYFIYCPHSCEHSLFVGLLAIGNFQTKMIRNLPSLLRNNQIILRGDNYLSSWDVLAYNTDCAIGVFLQFFTVNNREERNKVIETHPKHPHLNKMPWLIVKISILQHLRKYGTCMSLQILSKGNQRLKTLKLFNNYCSFSCLAEIIFGLSYLG